MEKCRVTVGHGTHASIEIDNASKQVAQKKYKNLVSEFEGQSRKKRGDVKDVILWCGNDVVDYETFDD